MDTHRYRSSLTWAGSTGDGYEHYGRAHQVRCEPATAALDVSADPTFRGDPALLNPEQLLLAAATSCQLLSFLAVAARARLDVVGYADDAAATMPQTPKPMRITQITLRPTITVHGEVTDQRLTHLVEVAHRECFIANSLRATITLEPTFLRVGRVP